MADVRTAAHAWLPLPLPRTQLLPLRRVRYYTPIDIALCMQDTCPHLPTTPEILALNTELGFRVNG